MPDLVLLVAGLMVLPAFLLFIILLLAMILAVLFDHTDSETEEDDDGEA